MRQPGPKDLFGVKAQFELSLAEGPLGEEAHQ